MGQRKKSSANAQPRRLSNAEIEMLWVDAWNDVYDLIGDRRDTVCMLPDWSIVSLTECLGWLRDSVYEGYSVRVEAGWVGHQWGVIAHRQARDAEPHTATDGRA